jgi:hypothetical protein
VWGWARPNSDDWRNSLALCQLCDGIPLQQANVDVIKKIVSEEVEQCYFDP